MPIKPKKPCRHPGCPKLTDGLYCEEHEALHRGDRASSSKRGYNRRWQKARARYLKAHPLCVQCMKEGKAVTATVVDHVKPHRGDRASSSKRGYNRQWQKARVRYLKAHPLCVQCLKEGHAVTATVVDHIRPHRGDPVLFWDEKNWQSLCKPCHDKKTWNEDNNPEYRF